MKIKELLSSKEKWIQGSFMRDKDGNSTLISEDAVSFCLVGAILVCYEEDRYKVIDRIRSSLPNDCTCLSDFNDNNDFETIKELVERLDI